MSKFNFILGMGGIGILMLGIGLKGIQKRKNTNEAHLIISIGQVGIGLICLFNVVVALVSER